jgi:exodeoxyribonuclease VII small subunit
MSNTGPEGTVPGAASDRGGAGLRPAGGAAGEGPSFEELQKELEDIVARLERGDVAVDDAIALFRRGEELYKACVERLQGAELRVEELSASDAE